MGTLSEDFVDSVCKMCVVVSRPMKIVTFLQTNGDSGFLRETLQQQRQTQEFVQDFACNVKNLRNLGRFRICFLLHASSCFFIFVHFY